MQGILVMDGDDNGMNGTHGRAEQSRGPVPQSMTQVTCWYLDPSIVLPLKFHSKEELNKLFP